MSIVLVGLSHRTAPIETRERLAFSETAIPQALGSLVDQNTVDEAVIVSTCNRVELIASTPTASNLGIERLSGFLCEFHSVDSRVVNGSLYRHADADAIKHLFRVASSLDSMVVGESQILGQVKEAYQYAVSAGTVGRVLSQLMHRAISVAKRVRTETGVAQHPVSVSSVAVELAMKVFAELEDKTILLVGAGEMAELAARSLIDTGRCNLMVTNRTPERAREIAANFGAAVVDFESLYDVLPSVDIVLCSTGAPDFVVRMSETKRALKARRKGPLLLIDISVPRNIEPAISGLENVFLFDVDDLDAVVKTNIREREQEAARAELIVEAEVQNFWRDLKTLDIGPAVVEVKQLLSQLAQSEFKRTRRRLGSLTPEQEAAIVEVLLPALVNKLSHPVIVHLRNASRNGESTEALNELRKLLRID
ncbi:MAG TPA: glutamyl-tRNA reductase [Blastocatellia bacterium]|nr:glutamyl-tRNA reductase [Blastocatellia bacterium]